MFDFIPQEFEKLVNIIFLVVTALIARHGITYRNEDGERDFVRLVFGCIAATYFFLVSLTERFVDLFPDTKIFCCWGESLLKLLFG